MGIFERNLDSFGYPIMFQFLIVPDMASLKSFDAIDPEKPDSEKYQLPLKMTYGDRRLLAAKADAAGISPTRWIIRQINESYAQEKRAVSRKPTSEELAISLDRQRREIAAVVAKELGFATVEDFAKDLIHQALSDPEMAEQFLFGKLRKRLRQEAREELEQASKAKRAA